jgi:hypothetical protein
MNSSIPNNLLGSFITFNYLAPKLLGPRVIDPDALHVQHQEDYMNSIIPLLFGMHATQDRGVLGSSPYNFSQDLA